jgi:hypothetical protein
VQPFSRFLTKTPAITSLLYGFSELPSVVMTATKSIIGPAGQDIRGPGQVGVTRTTFAATTFEISEAIEFQPRQVGDLGRAKPKTKL